MRDVAGPAELGPEVAAVGAAQIADAHARRPGVVGGVLPDHLKRQAHEPVRPHSPPARARRNVLEGIPRKEVTPLCG